MKVPGDINFDTLKPEEFERYLPELFANGDGKVSQDPRLKDFLARNPDCAALVSDLETIAETAKSLFAPVGDPSDKVWSNIQSKLREEGEIAGEEEEEENESGKKIKVKTNVE
jgi:hypothetical protein